MRPRFEAGSRRHRGGAARWDHRFDDLYGGRHDELMLAQLLFVLSYIEILGKEGPILR